MSSIVSVVVPYRPVPGRGRALDYVLHQVAGVGEIVVVDDPSPDGGFNRGRAINAGVARASGDVLVFHDADMVVPPERLRTAIDRVATGRTTGMLVPFDRLVGLGREASRAVLAGEDPQRDWPASSIDLDWDRRSAGGVNVISRRAFEAVGGFDPRFSGWGFEDAAFDAALHTLVAPTEWLPGRAVHLWHPFASDRGTATTDWARALAERYDAAAGDPVAMRALIAETRTAA